MLIIRTIAFGLGASAFLMHALFQYTAWHFLDSSVAAYSIGLLTLAESVGELSGMNSLFITAFTLFCLAVGLFMGSIIYSPFEEVLTRLLSRTRRSQPGSENRLMEAQR